MVKHTYPVKPEKCKGCPFYGDGTGFVSDEVNPGAKLTFFGARPGETEELAGKAYQGRTAKMMEGNIAKYGLKRSDANWVNAVRCRYRHTGEKPENYHEASLFCRTAHPLPAPTELVVPLDDESLKIATGLDDIETWRGSPIIADEGYAQYRLVIPTPHPSFIFSKPRMRTASKSDFARIARGALLGRKIFEYRDTFHTAAEVNWFLDFFETYTKEERFLTLDIETSRHKPIDAEMKIFGFGWAANGAANFNWDMLEEEQLDRLKGMVERAKCCFVTATPFDFTVLTKYGFRFNWERCHDLTLLHSRFDIELPHTVEFIASMWTQRKYWKNLGASDPYYYNCLDNAGEWEAFDKLFRYCKTNDKCVLDVYEDDRKHIRTAVKLHLTGIPQNKEVFKEERKIYKGQRDALEVELVAAFTEGKEKPKEPEKCPAHPRYSGKSVLKLRKGEEVICPACAAIAKYVKDTSPLNIGSTKQVMALLKAEGKKIPTKKNRRESLDKGAIEKLAVKYGDSRMVKYLEFKKRDTVVVRYFKEAKTSARTGRVHGVFGMHAAMHRWNCTKPNLQQIKRPEDLVVVDPETGEGAKEKHGPRMSYIASGGNVFLGFDGDGLHYRIAGCLSRDRFIIETLERYDKTQAPEHKPHIINTMALFKVGAGQAIDWMHAKASQYTFSKNFIYMILNGGDVPALHLAAVTAGLSLDVPQVRGLMNNWLDQAYMFRDYRASLVREAENTGTVTLDDGRRRRFYGLRWKEGKWRAGPDEIKEIYNLPLIGTEVSYVNPRVEKVLDYCETHPAWELVLYDHDGFMLHGPEDESKIVAMTLMPMLNAPMTIAEGKVLRVPWQPTTGKVWGAMEELKLGPVSAVAW